MNVRTLFRRGTAPASDSNAVLLGEHFASIRKAAAEIRDFREKTVYPTPTHKVQKQVDIETAWDSSRELFIQTFGVLNDIALRIGIEQGGFVRGCGFSRAVDAFIRTLDRVMCGLVDAFGTGRYPPKELKSINERILLVQSGINRLRKHVMEEFNYPKASLRTIRTENYAADAEKESPIIPLVTG